MTHPPVSVITPTTNRPEMLERCVSNFIKQDWHYENREMIIIHGGAWNDINHHNCPSLYIYKFGQYCVKDNFTLIHVGGHTIGGMRNIGCLRASGSIILHMDDDDLYAPDWISKSVAFLQQSKADIVGLSNAYFYDTRNQQLYEYRQKAASQLFLCGATLCYYRKAWERHPFREDIKTGEDMHFIHNNGLIYPHSYTDSFLATIHGSNTSSHLALNFKETQPSDKAHVLIDSLNVGIVK